MRTHDLVRVLAQNLTPVDRNAVENRLNGALMSGLAGATALSITLFGVASDMPEQLLTAAFWMRVSLPLALIAAALKLVACLVRPGMAVRFAGLMVMVPVVTMVLGATVFVLATPPAYRLDLFPADTSWRGTIGTIVLLSVPPLFAAIHAMRGLAPTRIALAGAGAGLLAGAQGGLIYAMYCPDMPVPYFSMLHVWVISITTASGAALASASLRW